MATEITPFAFGDNMVRVRMDENGEPWFVAKDVALALGYASTNMTTVFQAVPEEWRGSKPIATLGGMQELLTISEPGLYFFLGRSDKPDALPFQKWLAGEVLPSIRKTGSYSAPQNGGRGLPAGLSSRTRRYLQTFSAPRIALTESVLRLADALNLEDGQSAVALFDLYATVFCDGKAHSFCTTLPEDVQRRIWNDVKRLGGERGWSLLRQMHTFIGMCAEVESIAQATQKCELRASLTAYVEGWSGKPALT